MSYYFELENCNNIREAKITIKKNELNIKYGINGTGKSTISKAIEIFAIKGDVNKELHSFGCSEDSKVNCSCEINKVVVFNENYINTLVFDRDEVIKDSFNVFIKSQNYDERINKLNNRLKDLKVDLLGSKEIQLLINLFNTVTSKLVLTANNELKKNPFYKSVVTDKNLYNIPSKLKKYETFLLDNPKNIDWIDWKTKGHSFDDISGCPFCAEELASDYDEEKQVFSSTFKKATAINLKEMLGYFEELENYIVEDKYNYLIKCIKEIEDIETVEFELKKFTQELNYLKEKFDNIQRFDSFTIKQSDIRRIDEILTSLIINFESLNIFVSENMCNLIGLINFKINEIKEQVSDLKNELGQIRAYIQATVQKYKKDINDFLKSAGIKYEVDIKVNGENDALTTLHYVGEEGVLNQVESIKKHLSWGEKNAFALVLFMFAAIRQDPDLIILDDPISSFDSNKKYAIINRLFSNGQQDSFYKKTVLMLTHDFEPVIDFVINKKPTGGYVNAMFIKNNNGLISEKLINKNEGFDSYIRMLINYSKDSSMNPVSRLVFLR
jgi:ABC-type Mn2+/Zn2+ transport system ATPase subunit